MKTLELEEMQKVEAGGCGAEMAGGVVSIFALGAALSATGVGAPLGVGLALAGFGIAMYSAVACDM